MRTMFVPTSLGGALALLLLSMFSPGVIDECIPKRNGNIIRYFLLVLFEICYSCDFLRAVKDQNRFKDGNVVPGTVF